MIFTVEGNKIILDCCIKKVTDGNLVVYSRDGENFRVAATAMIKNGEYTELVSDDEIIDERYVNEVNKQGLYRGHDYYYYKHLYDGSRNRMALGIFCTALGVGFEISSLVFSKKEYMLKQYKVTSQDFFRAGAVVISVGVPLWISGSVRAANNEKAMEQINHRNSLTFGFNNDGLGLTYRF